jgi:hypothetical protein
LFNNKAELFAAITDINDIPAIKIKKASRSENGKWLNNAYFCIAVCDWRFRQTIVSKT